MHTHNLRERNYSYNYVASIVFIQAHAKYCRANVDSSLLRNKLIAQIGKEADEFTKYIL